MRYQEMLWSGKLGNDYTIDNDKEIYIKRKMEIFKPILDKKLVINTVLEYGANVGFNIPAIKQFYPKAKYYGVEINKIAYDKLKRNCIAYNQSIFDKLDLKADLVFTYGLLIHISPVDLNEAYKVIYTHSKKYILIVEHISKNPFTVVYRERENAFFKGDFINDIKKLYNLKLLRAGKVRGDLIWALLSKS